MGFPIYRSLLSCCRSDSMISYKTNKYKLHYLETPTGIRFAVTTDLGCPDMRTELRNIYRSAPHRDPLAFRVWLMEGIGVGCRGQCVDSPHTFPWRQGHRAHGV